MSAQSEINSIINEIEFKVSVYSKLLAKYHTVLDYEPHYDRVVEHYHFHMERRRFWLKKLLKVQLKEFSRV